MMAYVLINTELESECEVLEAVKKIEGVKEAHAVSGVYDIVLKVEAETMDKLKETVTWDVRWLNKVRSYITLTIKD